MREFSALLKPGVCETSLLKSSVMPVFGIVFAFSLPCFSLHPLFWYNFCVFTAFFLRFYSHFWHSFCTLTVVLPRCFYDVPCLGFICERKLVLYFKNSIV